MVRGQEDKVMTIAKNVLLAGDLQAQGDATALTLQPAQVSP